ncbi:MAG: GDP-mannose 4,6-dehydratase [Candidatus Helarchaeota archaeon]|nr:GDP-mannose 4,6-dehydratase [Candidatus Helarchaeota archaeon]
MKVLVTGGAGFIGSHLCEFLLEKGYSVRVIDDLSTGRYENVGHLEGNGKFKIIIDSVLNRSLVEGMVKSVDVVFHLASAVGVRLIIQQPVKTIETIVEGTNIVLSEARRYRRKVLITSSSEVYGKGSKVPFSEEDDTILGPTSTRRWAYAAAKGLDEFLAFAHWYETRLPVMCVRLFNTVGPRQTGQYGMVIPNFVEQALNERDITVYGNGEQTRAFCHVKDVVAALADLISCPEAIGKVINIGNNEEVSINHLANRVKELTGSFSSIVHIPYEKAYAEGFEDMIRRVPDISLAKKLIGFNPKYSLDDIIFSVIKSFKK